MTRIVAVSAAPLFTDGSLLFRAVLRRVAWALFGAHYADLERMEKVLRESGLDWTTVRPERLTDRVGTREAGADRGPAGAGPVDHPGRRRHRDPPAPPRRQLPRPLHRRRPSLNISPPSHASTTPDRRASGRRPLARTEPSALATSVVPSGRSSGRLRGQPGPAAQPVRRSAAPATRAAPADRPVPRGQAGCGGGGQRRPWRRSRRGCAAPTRGTGRRPTAPPPGGRRPRAACRSPATPARSSSRRRSRPRSRPSAAPARRTRPGGRGRPRGPGTGPGGRPARTGARSSGRSAVSGTRSPTYVAA